MNEEFDIAKFCKIVGKILNTKQEHPYNRTEWIASGELAKECVNGLLGLTNQLEKLLREISTDLRVVKPSFGVGYFPKVPWIALLAEGEKVSNGVFPVICFDANGRGVFIGCSDSIARPQAGFGKYCYSDEDLLHPERLDNGGFIPYDNHLARGAVWISREQVDKIITKECLIGAIKKADGVRESMRGKNPFIGKNENDVPRWVKPIKVNDMYKWLEFVQKCAEKCHVGTAHLIFRGQGKASWELKSTLERQLNYDGRPLDKERSRDVVKNENEAVERFRTISSQKLGYRQIKVIDLLALMQHYGGKTRLLDFTRSPLVALYMAIDHYYEVKSSRAQELDLKDTERDKEDDSFAVWAINTACLSVPAEESDWVPENDINVRTDDKNGNGTTDQSGRRVYVVEPKVLNARMAAQEGLFVMSNNIAEPLMATLGEQVERSDMFKDNTAIGEITDRVMPDNNSASCVYKFIFGSNMIEGAMHMLEHLCITPRVIYPDLAGMAKDATLRFCS